MPMTPTLNRSTEPSTDGAIAKSMGDSAMQQSPRRLAQEVGCLPTGRHAACRAFSRGLTRIASHAGCSAARQRHHNAAAEGERQLAQRKISRDEIDQRKQIAHGFADGDQRRARKKPAENRAGERTCKR